MNYNNLRAWGNGIRIIVIVGAAILCFAGVSFLFTPASGGVFVLFTYAGVVLLSGLLWRAILRWMADLGENVNALRQAASQPQAPVTPAGAGASPLPE